MQPGTPEPKGKLDAMTGHRDGFSTPVWDGSAWVRTAPVSGVAVTCRSANGAEGQPRKAPIRWDNRQYTNQSSAAHPSP